MLCQLGLPGLHPSAFCAGCSCRSGRGAAAAPARPRTSHARPSASWPRLALRAVCVCCCDCDATCRGVFASDAFKLGIPSAAAAGQWAVPGHAPWTDMLATASKHTFSDVFDKCMQFLKDQASCAPHGALDGGHDCLRKRPRGWPIKAGWVACDSHVCVCVCV